MRFDSYIILSIGFWIEYELTTQISSEQKQNFIIFRLDLNASYQTKRVISVRQISCLCFVHLLGDRSVDPEDWICSKSKFSKSSFWRTTEKKHKLMKSKSSKCFMFHQPVTFRVVWKKLRIFKQSVWPTRQIESI